MTADDSAGRVILLGATGFTGSRIAKALARRGASLVLAGRDPERLQRAAAAAGAAETAVVDIRRPSSIEAVLRRGDVLISTVGPFHLLGATVVEAAIAAGATYFDTTGEAPFIRRIFEDYGPRAEKAQTALLTAFGSDWVPGNAVAGLALRAAGDAVDRAVRVDVGYLVTGASLASYSRGTLASAFKVGLEPAYSLRDHTIRNERTAARLRHFDVAGRTHAAISVGGTEQFTVPRLAPTVGEVTVYLGWLGAASRAVQILSPVTALCAHLPGMAEAVSRFGDIVTRRLPEGPDDAAVAGVRNHYVAEVFGVEGRLLSRVVLKGPEVYGITAELLGWAAVHAARNGVNGVGALGPVDAFGLDTLLSGLGEAGVDREFPDDHARGIAVRS